MSVMLIQLLACLAAGYLLWRMWRALSAEDAYTRWIVFVGFMGRAIAGTVLFWISYLRLPFWRSLQMGDGLWFFGSDAVLYVPTAITAAEKGLGAIIGHSRTAASVSYVQSLALFAYLFGAIASVALLLNLFCYLGSCITMVKLRKATPAGRLPGTLGLAAISLSPSALLWSLQPLKDTLFQFLIIVFVAGCAMWQREWREGPSPRLLAASGAIMFAGLFLISGIRWYFALAALAASLAFFVMVGMTVPKKGLALGSGLIVFAVLTQAFIHGAGAYTPPRIMVMFSLTTPADQRIAALSPRALGADLQLVRNNFDRAGGNTSIGMGPALTRRSPTPGQDLNTAGNPLPPPAIQRVESESGSAADAVAASPSAASSPAPKADVPAANPSPNPRTTGDGSNAPISDVKPVVAPAPSLTATTVSAEQRTSKVTADTGRDRAHGRGSEDSDERREIQAREKAPDVVSEPVQQPAVPPAVVLPDSTASRITAGTIAMFVPRSLADRLRLIEVGGGKGFFWFTDLDTLFFDGVFVFTIVYFARRIRWATLRNPTFWFVVMIGLLVGTSLAYTITNFGTLFRMRMMIYTVAALLPLALAMGAADLDVPTSQTQPVPEQKSVQ